MDPKGFNPKTLKDSTQVLQRTYNGGEIRFNPEKNMRELKLGEMINIRSLNLR